MNVIDYLKCFVIGLFFFFVIICIVPSCLITPNVPEVILNS